MTRRKVKTKHNQAIRQYVLWRAARQHYNVDLVVDLTTRATRMSRESLYRELEKGGFCFIPGTGWTSQPLTSEQHIVESSAIG
jgi:hypothetical protein